MKLGTITILLKEQRSEAVDFDLHFFYQPFSAYSKPETFLDY